MKKSLYLFLFGMCVTQCAAEPGAFDWPQWQGPDRTAMSRETGLLGKWPADGPELGWRIEDLGGGYSAPAVAGGKLFGMSNRGDDEVVWCLNEKDGSEVWLTRLGPACQAGGSQAKEGPGCTPTVEGDMLYVQGGGGAIACLKVSSGDIVWQRDLVKDFGGRLPRWRYNESPLIDGEKLICTPGAEDATLLALNKQSGEVIWKMKVPEAKASESSGRSERRGPNMIKMDPVLKALDSDSDGRITADEIKAAAESLAALDKNKDGKLVEEEVAMSFGNRSGRGNRGGSRGGRSRGGSMRFMLVNRAIDADENRELSKSEIKDASTVLAKLDKNNDNELTSDEVSPQFGGRNRGPSSGAGYSSPIAIDFAGKRQYVQLTANTLVGVNAEDGSMLWRYDRPANGMKINCSTPIYQDGMVFASSAYGNGGGAVTLKKADGKAEEAYFTSNMQNHHGGMIVIDGCLYGANGGNGGGFLSCLDFKTGKVLWRDRGAKKGALSFADNRLYLYTEDGELMLIEPNAKKLIERGRFQQPDRSESPAWSHPVIANGKLYVRDQNLLLCYDVKANAK